ncbi:hypothetical protein PMAYCL1PPCAC_31135, partial [Pristionchus mayeri]
IRFARLHIGALHLSDGFSRINPSGSFSVASEFHNRFVIFSDKATPVDLNLGLLSSANESSHRTFEPITSIFFIIYGSRVLSIHLYMDELARTTLACLRGCSSSHGNGEEEEERREQRRHLPVKAKNGVTK